MVAIVGGGSTTGLNSSSLATLGNSGMLGDPALGRTGEKLYVNAASGNLVVQHEDEAMAALGGNVALLRTYNSLGLVDGDNNDGWQLGAVKTLGGLTGSLNGAGSTVTLTDTDGSTFVYKYVNATIGYQCTSGEGAYDRLKYANGIWTWTDGASQRIETYDWTSYQGLDSRNRPVTIYSGKILSSTDTEQNQRSYTYDAWGNGFLLRSITSASVGADGNNERLDFAWSSGKLQSVTRVTADGPTQHIGYSYDAGSGFLSAITISGTAAAGGGASAADTISYQYQNNLLWKIVQPDGSVTTISYVAGTGKVSQIDQSVNADVTRSTRFTYNSNTQTTITDPLGNSTVMNFNTTGALVSLKQPGGELVSYAYDTNGNLTSVTDARNNVTTYTYDSATGNRLSQKDAAGNTVSWTYGSKNEVLTRTDYFVPAAGTTAASDAHVTRYAYDDKDRLRFVLSPEGRITEYRYALDAQGRRVSEIQYSAALYPATGAATEAALQTWIAALAERSQVQISTTFYDARGQVQQLRRYAAVLANGTPVEDGAVSVTNYTYDAWGRLLNTSSADGGSASYVYDWLGRVVQSVDANNGLTTITYDDVGNTVLTRQVDNLNATASYNSAGDLLSVEKFTGTLTSRNTQQLTRYWYDAGSYLRMSQDPTGLKSHVLYDTDGRKAAEIDANGTMTEYAYNGNDQLISTTTYANALSAAALASLVDAAGNPAKVTVASLRPAANAADREVWKLYDLAGRLVKTIDELGQVTETIYDGASRITSVIRYAATVNAAAITASTKPTDAAAKPASSASDEKTRYFYDSDDRLLATLDAAGSLVENEYDAAGRLRHTIAWATATNSTLRASGTLAQLRPARDSAGRDLDSWVFYDRQGRRIGEVDGEGYLTETTYDRMGRASAVIRYAGKANILPAAITQATTLDQLRPAGASQSTRYTYTASGQIDTCTHPDQSVIRYSYDALDRLLQTVNNYGTDAARSTTLSLDALGRIRSQTDPAGDVRSYTYDAAGRVIASTDQNGNATLFYYDGDGNLVYQIDAAGEVLQNTWNTLEQLTQVTRYATRLSAAQLAGMSGGMAASVAANIAALANAALDHVQSYAYTLDGHIKTESDELGRTRSTSYNAFDLVQWRTDESGNTTRYVYDANERLIYSVDGANGITALAYDALGRLLSTTRYATPATAASITPNAAAPLTAAQVAAAIVANPAIDRSDFTVYNEDGQAAYRVTGTGAVHAYTYDAWGNVTAERAYANPIVLPAQLTLASMAQAVAAVADNSRDQQSYRQFDSQGHVILESDGSGHVSGHVYDANGNLAASTSYANRLAVPSQLAMPTADPAHDIQLRYSYDADGRVLRKASSSTWNSSTGTLNWSICAYTYDAAGQLLSSTEYANLQTDPAIDLAAIAPSADDRISRSVYDAVGRLAYAIDASGAVTQFTYDAGGRLLQSRTYVNRVNVSGNPSASAMAALVSASAQDRVERSVYDSAGRAVYTIDAVGALTQFSYDGMGRVTQKRQYANTLNIAGNPSLAAVAAAVAAAAQASAADRIERTVYDADGRAVFQIDGLGNVSANAWDGADRLVGVRRYAQAIATAALGAAPTAASVTSLLVPDAVNDRWEQLVRDADGRLLFDVDGAGYGTQTSYDALGQVTRTVRFANKVAITVGTVSSAAALQAAFGNPRAGVDAVISQTWTASGQLASRTDERGYTESFTYDGTGAKTSFTNKQAQVWNYEHDAAGRIVAETAPAVDVGSMAITAAGVVNSALLAGQRLVTRTAWNAFGEVAQRIEAAGVAGQERSTRYLYDRLGRQTATLFPPASLDGAAPPSTPSAVVSYDALGLAVLNQDVGGLYSYKVYDAQGRVLYDIDAAGTITGYVRNAFGEVTQLTRYQQAMSVGGANALGKAAVDAFLSSAAHGADRVITTSYDNAGRVAKVLEPAAYAYDASHSGNNRYATVAKATVTVYNAFGETLRTSVYGEAAGVAASAAADTFYVWNVRGQQVAQIDIVERTLGANSGDGYLTTMQYDGLGRQVDRIEYALRQNFQDAQFSTRSGMAYSAPTDPDKRETVSTWDLAGNKLSETRKAVEIGAADGTSVTGDASSAWTYDELGKQRTATDASGAITTTWRDALGRITAVSTVSTQARQNEIAKVYLAVLGRVPSAGEITAGMSNAASALVAQLWSASNLGALSDSAFIAQLYQNLAARNPDAGGAAFWAGRLAANNAAYNNAADPAAGRKSTLLEFMSSVTQAMNQDTATLNARVATVANGKTLAAANSDEARRILIAELYSTVLGRAPDPAGLAFYTTGAASALPGDQVAQQMFDSAEGQQLYPPSSSLGAVAGRIYEAVYGHAPSAAELASVPLASRSGVGAFVTALVNRLFSSTDPAQAAAQAAFTSKAMAGLPEALDVNGTPGTLTSFTLDAYGNAVLRTDYAQGAQFVGGNAIPAAPGPGDHNTYTQFDINGHAIAVLDANGNAAFSAWDAYGRDVRDWRNVSDAQNLVTTVTQTRSYDARGQLRSSTEGDATRNFSYNAFGEVVRRDLNGSVYEKNDYDNAGHLWRSNAADGVSKVYLYDVWGHQTARLQSAEEDLGAAAIATAAQAVARPSLVRTDFVLDLAGNVLTESDPTVNAVDVGTVNGTVVTGTPTASLLSLGVTPTIQGTMGMVNSGFGQDIFPVWSGYNSVRLDWPSLAGLGAGDLRVELVVTERTDFGFGGGVDAPPPTFVSTTVDQDMLADAGLTGALVSWQGSGALSSIDRIKLYKKDAQGNWALLMDRTAWGNNGQALRIDAPADPRSVVSLQYRASGSSPWISVPASQLLRLGDALVFDISSLREGTYDYQVLTQSPADSAARVVESGDFGLVADALRAQIAQLYALLFNRAPDLDGINFYLQSMQATSGAWTIERVAQALIDSNENPVLSNVNPQVVMDWIRANGMALSSAPGGDLGTMLADTAGQMMFLPVSSRGAVLAAFAARLAGYAGADATAVAARTLLANKVSAGLYYGVTAGGYIGTEAQAVMATLNAGGSLAAAQAAAAPALYRRMMTGFYVALFNRVPDAAGLASNLGDMLQYHQTLADVANNFYNSNEAKTGGLVWNADGSAISDTAFVTQVYQLAGNKTVTSADLAPWLARLQQTSRGQVLVEMVNSIANYAGTDASMLAARQVFNNKIAVGLTYASTVGGNLAGAEYKLAQYSTGAATAFASAQAAVNAIQAEAASAQAGVTPTRLAANATPIEEARRQVAQLYAAVLDRAPDAGGLDYYVKQLIGAPPAQPRDVALGMLNSDEGRAIYQALSNSQFVSQIFSQTLGRAASAAELATWTAALQTQDRSAIAVQIVDSIVNASDSASQSARNLLQNKAAVGIMYALDMDGSGDMATCKALMDQVTATDTATAIATAKNQITLLASNAAATAYTYVSSAYTKAGTAATAAKQATTYAQTLVAQSIIPTTTGSQRFTGIAQLYRAIFQRDGTYLEFDYHYTVMVNNNFTMGQEADILLASPEGQGWFPPSQTNTRFLNSVYQAVVGRAIDSGGLSFWGNQLSSGFTRGQVLVNIINGFLGNDGAVTSDLQARSTFGQKISSVLATDQAAAAAAGYAQLSALTTAANRAAADYNVYRGSLVARTTGEADAATIPSSQGAQYLQVQQLYLGGLNRAASLQDENYWFCRLQSTNINILAQEMIDSAEGQTLYGGTSNAQFVDRVYRNTFGRPVDASGSTFWTNALNTQTRGQVLVGIINSMVNYSGSDASELQNKTNFLNRVSSGMAAVNSAALAAKNNANTALQNWVSSAVADANGVAAGGDASALSAFNASAEARTRKQIVQLYLLLLNHGPDYITLNNLVASGQTTLQIAQQILASPEAQGLYGSLTGSAFIIAVFQTSLGRAPNASNGDLNYSGSNAQIAVNIANAISTYSGSDVYDLQAMNVFNNKVTISLKSLAATAQSLADSAQAIAADATRVLAANPRPLDVLVPSSWIVGTASGAQQIGARPTIVRTWDRWGKLKTQTDARNAAWVTQYSYNANGQLKSVRDAGGAIQQYYYDALGRTVATRDARGYVNGYVYDLQGHVVEELHADGGEVQNRYDAFGNLVQQRLADGQTTAWGYDALGHIISKTIAPNTLVEVYATTVDDIGSWTPHAATQLVGKVLTETYGVDQLGRRVWTVDANGKLSQTFYDLHGNVLQTIDALGRSTRYAYDAFGHKTDQADALGLWQHWDWDAFRVSRYQDVGGHVTTTAYNSLGLIKTQQSDLGQDLRYTYDSASGLLVKIEDRSLGGGQAKLTQYAWDLAGNHTREKTSIVRISDGAELDVAQDNHLSWDALGRLVEVSDARQRLQYGYDAVGNMIHQITTYDLDNDPTAAGPDAITNWQDSPTTQDLWNSYDSMNRQTVINGRSSNGGANITIDATQGTHVNYDSYGHQITSTGAGTLQNGTRGLVATGYSWDAAGRLADTWRMDAGDIEQRRYDATGHLLQSQQLTSLSSGTLNTIGVNAMLQLSAYDAAGQLKVQALVKGSGQRPALTTHYEYDAAGRMSSYDMSNHDAGFARRSYYSYAGRADGKLITQIKMWSEFDGGALDSVVGQTDNSYDANGFLIGVQGSAQNAQDTRSFVNDAQGHVLRKTQVDAKDASVFHVTRSLIANGQELGSSSDTTAPTPSTFGQDYEPVAASGGPMLYTVQAGDTLSSIARNLWGNADWWYVIADANGSSTLTPGQILNIPPRPTALYNSIDTIKPYDAALAMGDLSPTVAPPAQHGGGCGGMGAALAMIVTVVVAAITQQYWLVEEGMAAVETAGGAAEAAGELGLDTLSEATLADIGAAVPGASLTATTLGAAAGSIAGQLTRIATGDQHGFDWKQLGLSAISAGMSYGLSGLELTGMQAANKVAQAVIANALTQGIGVVTGLQQSFNWRAVAASAANAGVNHSTGGWFADQFGGTPLGDFGATLGLGLAGGAAAAAARGGRISVGEVALDAFGNALGSSLGREAESASAPGRNAEIVSGPEAADPVLNPPISADAIAWPGNAIVPPDEAAPGIDGGSIDSILRRQGIGDGSGYFLSQPTAASAWKMFDGDRAMMGEFKRLNGLADADSIRADRYYKMPIAGEFDEAAALSAQIGQDRLWQSKARIEEVLAHEAARSQSRNRYDPEIANWTRIVTDSIARTESMLDANYEAWVIPYNAGVVKYNESLRQPWVESLPDGKYAAELYTGWGGGIEIGIADGKISDVKLQAGYGKGARFGRIDGIASEALQGRATAYKAEVAGGPWIASAPSMPNDLRFGLAATAGGALPGLSADLLNASMGFSTAASHVVYGQFDRPSIALDPTQLLRPSSWRPELSSKLTVDLSYTFIQPKPLALAPLIRPK